MVSSRRIKRLPCESQDYRRFRTCAEAHAWKASQPPCSIRVADLGQTAYRCRLTIDYQIPKTKSSAGTELSGLLGKVREHYQGMRTVIPVLPTTS